MEPVRAHELIERDSRNADVLFPYLNGQDLNTRPDNSASRWVINFFNWSEDKARSYPECYDQVRRLVKPERARNSIRSRREKWWWYSEYRRGLIEATAELDRIIVIARISKTVMPAMVFARQVANEKTVIFATDDTAVLALLSSAVHYWWAISHSSTMKTDLNYAPSDVFETLPLPGVSHEMRELGERLDVFRRELMLARQAGLTATYNLVHDPKCADADIQELRNIHRAIDVAVVRAYGWADLLDAGLDHGFHDTRQGTRYMVGPAVKQEILDRLLEFNHARYAEEERAGLHAKKPSRKRFVQDNSDTDALF